MCLCKTYEHILTDLFSLHSRKYLQHITSIFLVGELFTNEQH